MCVCSGLSSTVAQGVCVCVCVCVFRVIVYSSTGSVCVCVVIKVSVHCKLTGHSLSQEISKTKTCKHWDSG